MQNTISEHPIQVQVRKQTVNEIKKTPCHGISKTTKQSLAVTLPRIEANPVSSEKIPSSSSSYLVSIRAHKPRFCCKFLDCGQTFTKHFNLKRHVLLCHTTIQPFKCLICGKRVALIQYFRDHLLQHLSVDATEHYLRQDDCVNQQVYPLFFVEKTDDNNSNLVNDYVKAKILPQFVTNGVLPVPKLGF
mmetsp:Transcript_2476/g.2593  ORF Transcript_2476/g.2593 Transcript_2476/m.2593 type:complete len:189 (+) Transcript_2476:192-758(+)